MGTIPSNLDAESIPIDSAKLMKRNFVSRVMWTQGDPVSDSDTCMIKGTSSSVKDHRCGACHNTSDAKVRIELWNKYGIIRNAQLSLSFLGVIFFVPFHGKEEGFVYLALGSSRCGVNVSFRLTPPVTFKVL